ncbi:metal ABC transporter solute-binding protein, Zn/Mn family, partial [Gardnerella vaginalis]
MKLVDLLGKKSVKRAVSAALAVLTALPLTACGSANGNRAVHRDGRINVVTTTGVLRDMVANVAGEAANVSAIVPDNADPH